MGIQYDEQKRMFKLDTENTTYIIGISEEGYVGSALGSLEEDI